VCLSGWLVLAYAGPPETTNCADETFHDWHLEIFEKPSDDAPQVGDPTPIICEITPRTERIIYRDGVRIRSLAGFFRLQGASYQATGHKAQKVRLTGYLLWDDDHNGSADVGSTIEYIGSNKLHSSMALDSLGNSSCHENRGDRVKYWEIIADNLAVRMRAPRNYGCESRALLHA
jgi:hypothetical protein